MNIENLNTGDFIAVLEASVTVNERKFEITAAASTPKGDPLEVISISAPFVLCQRVENAKPVTLHWPSYHTTKLLDSYVAEWKKIHRIPDTISTNEGHTNQCPLCSRPMLQGEYRGSAALTCRDCKHWLIREPPGIFSTGPWGPDNGN